MSALRRTTSKANGAPKAVSEERDWGWVEEDSAANELSQAIGAQKTNPPNDPNRQRVKKLPGSRMKPSGTYQNQRTET